MTTDTYTKIVLTICAVCLVWLSLRNTPLEPVVSAQGGFYIHSGTVEINCSYGCP